MNTAAALNRSPSRTRDLPLAWQIEDDHSGAVRLRVTFYTTWPSVRDRGYGIGMQVVVEKIEQEVDGLLVPALLNRAQHAAVQAEIEGEEELRYLEDAEA